jgi:hypothetical protein
MEAIPASLLPLADMWTYADIRGRPLGYIRNKQ